MSPFVPFAAAAAAAREDNATALQEFPEQAPREEDQLDECVVSLL